MSRFRALPRSFYLRDAETVARDLLGRYLVRRMPVRRVPEAKRPSSRRLALRIVETEAYLGEGDRASHAWRGVPTPRTETLFRQGGCAYVYLIYGLYDLFNVVVDGKGLGCAVLVRAGEPVEGSRTMARKRGVVDVAKPGVLAGGPGKLCQALAIDRGHDGVSLLRGEVTITQGSPVGAAQVAVGPRVGVDYAGDAAAWPLRFAERGNPHVSRPFPW